MNEAVKNPSTGGNPPSGQKPSTGGSLSFSSKGGLINRISVWYPPGSDPQSGQNGGQRSKGLYSYDTSLKINVIQGGGDINGKLAWQYYIFRNKELITADREIVPFGQSDQRKNVGPLQNGDVITWRLVAIFGP